MRKIALVINMLLLCLILCGCEPAATQEDIARWESQAQLNAQEYVRQKYSFDADFASAECDYGLFFGVRHIPLVYVNLTYDGKEFTVYIDGENETAEGMDTYQAAEIRAALEDDLRAHGLNLISLEPDFRSPSESHDEPDTLYRTLYTGDNLYEMTQEALRSFRAYCVGNDLSDASAFDYLREYFGAEHGFLVTLYNCRGEEHLSDEPLFCAETLKLHQITGENPSFTAEYKRNDLYEDSSGILVCVLPQENGVQSPPSIMLTQTNTPDMAQFVGHGFGETAHAVSAAYHIKAEGLGNQVLVRPNCIAAVYIPQSMIEDFKPIPMHAVNPYHAAYIRTDSDGTLSLGRGDATPVGDYLRVDLSFSQAAEYTFFIAARK